MISEVRASSDCQRVSSSMHGSRKLAPLYTGTSMLSIMDDDSMVGVALCCQAPGPPTIRSRLLLPRSRWTARINASDGRTHGYITVSPGLSVWSDPCPNFRLSSAEKQRENGACPTGISRDAATKPDRGKWSLRKRKRVEPGQQIPATAGDEQRDILGDLVRAEKRYRDHPASRGGPGTARDLADLTGPLRDLIAADRRDVGVDPQAEELAAHLAHVRPAGDRFLADIAPFRE